jgi:hypothetical protein
MQGHAVALSGDGETLVVGTPSIHTDSSAVGRVRVLRYDSVDGWIQLGAAFTGENENDYLVICAAICYYF